MKLSLRFRRTASLGAVAVLGLSGCHLFGSREEPNVPHHSERPVLVEPAPAVSPAPAVPSPILPPAPDTKSAGPDYSPEPQRLPIAPPPAIPPAAEEEPVPTAGRSTIRPICFQFASSSSCCPATCCDPCSPSLLSRLTAPWHSARWRMECMKASVKHRLRSLNPFNKCRSCAPVSSCCVTACDPCSPCITDGYVIDGTPVTGYSHYPMQPPAHHQVPAPYPVSMHPGSVYPPVTAQPGCPSCRNQAGADWATPQPVYSPPPNPAASYGYTSDAYGHAAQPHPQWQQHHGPDRQHSGRHPEMHRHDQPQHDPYQYQQPAQPHLPPQPVLPQPQPAVPNQPRPAPSTTLYPTRAPAAQVAWLPGYADAVAPVRQAVR